MYRRYIIILNFPNFYPSKIDYKSCFKNHRALWDFSAPLYFATLRFVQVEMTCWGLSFANYYDVKYFFTIFYILFNFIYLSRLAIKRRYFPYTSSRPKWVKLMKWRDLILLLKQKWMYCRYITTTSPTKKSTGVRWFFISQIYILIS